MNRVIIEDVWYIVDGKDVFVYEWPESCREIFKQLFKLNKIVNKYC